MLRRLLALVAFSFTACGTVAIEPTTVQSIHSRCKWSTTYDGCADIAKKPVLVEGIIWYDSEDRGALLFPIDADVEAIDFWERGDTPNWLDLKLFGLKKSQKLKLTKFHKKQVQVNAITNTECVLANAWLHEESGKTDEILMLSGYCHTQGDTYLTDFKIKLLEKQK